MSTGIRRRVEGGARRARAEAPVLFRPAALLPAAPHARRPVFILGAPRSGTSMIFKLLRQSRELRSIGDEGHALWEAFHHPSRHAWESNALTERDVSARERRFVHTTARAYAGRRRFLDKTPKNCLRIPYLLELFPDASFVFLKRRAAANISSLIDGWRARPRYVTYALPEPLRGPGVPPGGGWSFALVPGWRGMLDAPIAEVCARQWLGCNEAVLAARSLVADGDWFELAYEDVVADPVPEVEALCHAIGVEYSDALRGFAENLHRNTVNTVSPPEAGKWRQRNRAAVEAVLPLTVDLERRLGYESAGAEA